MPPTVRRRWLACLMGCRRVFGNCRHQNGKLAITEADHAGTSRMSGAGRRCTVPTVLTDKPVEPMLILSS